MTSFYGSNLWNFTSASAVRLYSSWNTNIRTAFDLPFGTHRFILKELSDLPPLQETLQKRFTKFCEQIKNCGKAEVIHLFNKQKYDSRSTFGQNYKNIVLDKTEINNYITPEAEEWKIPMIRELIDISNNKSTIQNLSAEEVKYILSDLACT